MAARDVTMADVARAAGVSRQLVSIALRGAPGVGAETKEHILATARRLGYHRNALASRLASRSADVVGLYLQDLRNEVFADVHDGLRETIAAEGLPLVLGVGVAGSAEDRSGLRTLIAARVGVLVAAGVVMPDAELLQLAERIPLVMVSRAVPGLDSVYSDDTLGARKATEHLLKLGHRRIAHVAAPDGDGYRGRRRAYEACMASAGLAPQVVVANYSRVAAAQAVGPLLDGDDAPTAVFCHNDTAALGVMDALASRGLALGEDVSLVGYDDSEAARLPAISLTSVDLHAQEMGRRAGEVAVQRLRTPGAPVVDESSRPTLVVRGSTAPPRE